MPEGDTVFRTAATLERAIGGKRIVAFRSKVPALADARLDGVRVARVEALGKNLLACNAPPAGERATMVAGCPGDGRRLCGLRREFGGA